MAVRALIFGVDDLFPQLQPFYEMAVQRVDIDIVGYAVFEKDGIRLYPATGGGTDPRNFEVAIISSNQNFYDRMKMLENLGVPRNRIIDGRVFKVPNLNFARLLTEDIAYGVIDRNTFGFDTRIFYKTLCNFRNSDVELSLGKKSYIGGISLEINNVTTKASILIGNFSSISWAIVLTLGLNGEHDYHKLTSYPMDWSFGWEIPTELAPPMNNLQVSIGNDVWIGRGSILKCTNPEKPLVIGDGAVIASDSVVVKSVPPYAIVGGNPAQIIKYRFSDKIIESLLRIKWWDWDIDKIHDNFQYFNRIEEFVEMHDVRR